LYLDEYWNIPSIIHDLGERPLNNTRGGYDRGSNRGSFAYSSGKFGGNHRGQSNRGQYRPRGQFNQSNRAYQSPRGSYRGRGRGGYNPGTPPTQNSGMQNRPPPNRDTQNMPPPTSSRGRFRRQNHSGRGQKPQNFNNPTDLSNYS
jgi:hypothetical protein